MATDKGDKDKGDKPKLITREEVEALGHKDLAKVATKRRILASLPTAEEAAAAEVDDDAGDDEDLTPRQRIARGHAKAAEERDAAEEGLGLHARLSRAIAKDEQEARDGNR
jgi:hypothetical protein